MSRDSLTAKYRPQSFARVAGQDFIKKILSRACAQNRIASAYIFSGTRGVGKTTLARILAKGMNCLEGPGEEPCNRCQNCRQITAGTSMDVMEIDGASYTGVDNVRRLREEVFYSPLACRFKVVIIDEVHMLSKSAFNALLKTIEEPPAHCVFIMATTEPKKIPATIISRCQHFVFKSLSRADLETHLNWILEAEEIEYEPQAVNILAKRGDGSVRDSMSLLGQVLALGGEKLTETDVRQVLGLAGQEFFLELIQAVYNRDVPALERMMDDLLDQGLDLGFFLRELAQSWRNMFLIQQAGDKAFDLLDMDKEFESQWADLARKFPPGFVHAAWQMVLDSQYGILKSLEPGQALELLLLNLAYLPQLLPLSSMEDRGSGKENIPGAGRQDGEEKKKNEQSPGLEPVERQETGESAEKNTAGDSGQQEEKKDFSDFLDFCAQNCRPEEIGLNALRKARAYWPNPQKLVISCGHRSQGSIFQENGRREKLLKLCREFFGNEVQLEIELPEEKAVPSKDELKKKALNDPGVRKVLDKFNARLIDVQVRDGD